MDVFAVQAGDVEKAEEAGQHDVTNVHLEMQAGASMSMTSSSHGSEEADDLGIQAGEANLSENTHSAMISHVDVISLLSCAENGNVSSNVYLESSKDNPFPSHTEVESFESDNFEFTDAILAGRHVEKVAAFANGGNEIKEHDGVRLPAVANGGHQTEEHNVVGLPPQTNEGHQVQEHDVIGLPAGANGGHQSEEHNVVGFASPCKWSHRNEEHDSTRPAAHFDGGHEVGAHGVVGSWTGGPKLLENGRF